MSNGLRNPIIPLLLLFASSLVAQTQTAAYVPMPFPGYALYYHDADGAPNLIARWGYNDGWQDGRHDRNHGDVEVSKDKERYANPPEHDGHPGITLDRYRKLYRDAYVHGYEHGSRL